MIKAKFLSKSLLYDGSQLCAFWIRSASGLRGDAMLAYCGGARVREHMVDMEDREAADFIYSPLMLHFMVEHFHMPLAEAVVRQRLLMAIIHELLLALRPTLKLLRAGDDLYFGKKKLSVSIATLSPMSALLHVGLNIETKGTPVATIGLKALRIDAKTLALRVMQAYQSECESMAEAAVKVLPVL